MDLLNRLKITAIFAFIVGFIVELIGRRIGGPTDGEIRESSKRLDDHDAEILGKQTTEIL